MALNKQQRIAAKAYGSGDFAHVISLNEAGNVGDTLFLFVMREMSDEEDCESLDEGINRMRQAIDDLQVVLDALAKEDK